MIIDLSGPIRDGAEWFGAPCEPVAIRPIGALDTEGWRSHVIRMTVVSGTTYIETGGHVEDGGPNVEDIPLARLVLDARVWRCPVRDGALGVPPEAGSSESLRGKALLLLCGWHRRWGTAGFADESPFLGPALQDAILERAPAVLGSDSVSFDGSDRPGMPFLRRYFATGGAIVSPLCPEREFTAARGRLVVAPLKLTGTNASPCRVFIEC